MTIRRALAGWYRFLWVGMMLVGAVGLSWRDTGYNHTFRMSVISLLLVSVFAVFGCGFRCPRCRTSLITRAATILSSSPCGCPKCGVSMDDPRESPANLK